jgi:transaldolase
MMKTLDTRHADRIRSFILEKAEGSARPDRHPSDPFWRGLRDAGTELWLDTGDIEAAGKLWTAEFSALTTNNTLLNKEVQKGIYDRTIQEAGALLGELEPERRVMEIAFILNALHGLRLVKSFDAKVSVELHTATAHDVEEAVAYGRRFSAVSPDRFIIKVPLTAAGLLATRILRLEGVPVNFTLGFSARQNHLAASFAFPNYVNVFLGRLNAYVSDNGLGDGLMVGEKATLASQHQVSGLSRESCWKTLQIAASMRGGSQVRDLAGVDVMTMPVATAEEARSRLTGPWESSLEKEYAVSLAAGVDPRRLRLSVLWDVTEAEKKLARALDADPPRTAEELAGRAREGGVADMFPTLGPQDGLWIAKDGKIPKHERWEERIARSELAVDTLLNLAGLASFTADQTALDGRVRGLLR